MIGKKVEAITLDFRPIDETGANFALSWRYDPPYDVYNSEIGEIGEDVRYLLDPKNNYYSIIDEDANLLGFCCFGRDARVPGGDYRAQALDIGMGLRPDLTGKGHGIIYVNAVLDFARRTFASNTFRVTVAEFNKRALRVWEKAFFRPIETFARDRDKMVFVVLTRKEAT